jgi:DNA repair exonuclease SbcCD ATPase subunit
MEETEVEEPAPAAEPQETESTEDVSPTTESEAVAEPPLDESKEEEESTLPHEFPIEEIMEKTISGPDNSEEEIMLPGAERTVIPSAAETEADEATPAAEISVEEEKEIFLPGKEEFLVAPEVPKEEEIFKQIVATTENEPTLATAKTEVGGSATSQERLATTENIDAPVVELKVESPPPTPMKAGSYLPHDVAKELETLRRELQLASEEKSNLQKQLVEREDELERSQHLIQSLEQEIEKQLLDWDQLADKMVEADNKIQGLMKEAQQVEGLKAKLEEYESLKSELDKANSALASVKQKTSPDGVETVGDDGNAVETNKDIPDDKKADLEKKLSEKDEVISFLQNELDRHKNGESANTKLDFTSLNASLQRFTAEISSAKNELEEAQKKIGTM